MVEGCNPVKIYPVVGKFVVEITVIVFISIEEISFVSIKVDMLDIFKVEPGFSCIKTVDPFVCCTETVLKQPLVNPVNVVPVVPVYLIISFSIKM